MARETIIPSVSVEVIKEVVPPSPAATGIVAILGSTEKGPLVPTRIDRYPTFRDIFGVGSSYSMPEAKHVLQNGAKELVIVRLENGSRSIIQLNNIQNNPALEITARAEGIWGNEIRVQILQGRASGTVRMDIYYQSDEPVETFDNLSMHPSSERYLANIINSQSELVSARDLTGRLPGVMQTRRAISGGTDGVIANTTLTGTANTIPDTPMIDIQARELGENGNNLRITTTDGAIAGTYNITIDDITNTAASELHENVDLNPGTTGNYIITELNNSNLVMASLHSGYVYTSGDTLDIISAQALIDGTDRVPATFTITDSEEMDIVLVTGRDPGDGSSGNGIFVRVDEGVTDDVINFYVWYPGNTSTQSADADEAYENVNIDPDSPDYMIRRVNEVSTRIELEYLAASETLATMGVSAILTGGANPDLSNFEAGLSSLEREPDVDIVVPSIQYPPPSLFQQSHFNYSQNVFAAVDSHCKLMSQAANNRIGFGGVSRMERLDQTIRRTTTIGSDRFVIVSPHGVVGAVAGLIGRLTYYYSPTFKAITGFTTLERDFSPTDLRTLLRANIVPLDAKKGIGIIIIRGLTTDGDQISVRRVADYAVRNVKNIAERFIGNLNTQDGRAALKQKIIEFFRQMEKDNAIVPSTDGTDPAFKVDVYSTQRDFALGIVRVDIAVRPVRAIDFIYATILVQV
ncbi:MAG: phage tail sheath subtilisin-like domain-containing protein [Methanomassiliicoccales archaeon]|nr:MAG: phage tail sheath subtilisin-like domain-containing protein [Methanomassiliicoccales archaeon]